MEYSFAVRRQPAHVEVAFTGLLVSDAIVAILDRIAWPRLRSTMRGLLWDLRAADLSAYSIDDMARLRAYDDEEAERVPTGPPDGRRFRIAAVFAGGSDQLILRLWESSGGVAGDLERRSFDDIDDARRWVAEP
ncbi:hypothetical protein GCM10017083_52250 [Thalassobaculum fulvum]|uniref:SpoIIAA-like n=1 Tax=Thalassobaculum fulvum TaxID=1633335 RepID=A0A919CSK6_9PROT|nr:hypothetical protein [Thalassobaculum fulvum]GHD62851.1 hypothetical protein GCM10017083_52250 [Thalassobaculum fulvum]